MSSENARFEVYDKTRDEVPDTVDDLLDASSTVFDEIEPDEVIVGYDTLRDFLDSNTIEREVDVSEKDWREGDTATVAIGKYFWSEMNVETAPEHTVCSTCEMTLRTRSDERLSEARQSHHASTGH